LRHHVPGIHGTCPETGYATIPPEDSYIWFWLYCPDEADLSFYETLRMPFLSCIRILFDHAAFFEVMR
jgi:hypothetical protein